MKRIFLLAILAMTYQLAPAQLFLGEDFEGFGSIFDINSIGADSYFGDGQLNQWGINAEYGGASGVAGCSTNPITIDGTASAPASFAPGGTYMHIMSDEGFPLGALGTYNANYMPSDGGVCYEDTNYFSKMNLSVNTVGMEDTEFKFWWLGQGSDYAWGEVWYSIDDGATWTKETSGVSDYKGTSAWTEETLMNPAWDGVPFLRFAFRFVNNTDPVNVDNLEGFAVDEIAISATDDGSCANTFYSFSVNQCNEYTSPSGIVYTSSGVVNDTIPNAAGCDSVMTITMTITEVDDSVWMTTGNDSIQANADDIFHTFIWIDCDSLTPLAGEIDNYLVIPYVGSFAVIVNDGTCIDTSECIQAIGYGINENVFGDVKLYPNPSSERVNIEFAKAIDEIDFTITDVTGKVYRHLKLENVLTINDILLPEAAGIYIIRLITNTGESKSFEVIKQ